MQVELNGKAEWVAESRQKNGIDDSRTVTTKIRREAEASVDIELSEGHPNLDAWSPDYRVDSLASLAEREGDFREWSPVEGTWDIIIYGNAEEWVPTLISYLSERPSMSLSDVINRFLRLDGFEDGGLKSFLEKSEDGVDKFDVEQKELGESEWEELKGDIRKVVG